MESRKILLAFALKYANDWNRMYDAIKSKEELSEEDISRVDDFNGNYITILDAEYPDRLKQKFKPPFVLYYEGDLSLLERVGSGKNDLIFLHGPNLFRIPTSRLCTITADNKIDICGGLRVWFNKHSDNIDRFGLATGLCHIIVGTKIYPAKTRSWFLNITIPNALHMGCDVYMRSSARPSYNNQLIKDGVNLIDSYSDIK